MISHLVLEITNACPLNCRYCYIKKGRTFMSVEKVREVLERFEPEFVSISGGEPLLHPEIERIMRIVSEHADFEVLTSGILHNKLKLLRDLKVQVTIDGPEIYHNRMRGLYSKVLEGARFLAKNSDLTVVSVLTEENWHSIGHVLQLSDELGASVYRVIRMVPVRKELKELVISKFHALEVARFLREARKYSDMEIISFWLDTLLELEEKGKYSGICAAKKYKLVVSPEFEIYPCEFLRIPLEKLSNVDFQSFRGCPAMAYHIRGIIGSEEIFQSSVSLSHSP